MASDSTQTGYLTELGDDAVYGESLDTLLSRWLKAICNYPDGMVRARWQSVQAPLLPVTADWCAFGVTNIRADYSAGMMMVDSDTDSLYRHEAIDCLASFYGPDGMGKASLFRDGIAVEQNNQELNRSGMTLFDTGDIIPFPELINNQWVRRYDLLVTVRRKITRRYGIQSLTEAPVQFFGD